MKRSKYNMPDLPNSEIAHLIDEWIHDETYRQVLKRIYIDGITNEKAADEFGLSVNTIKNIVKFAIPILREK